MPLLSTVEVAKHIPERTLFASISCAVESGERIGLVGRNGSGKSTFVRVLVGEDTPDVGEVVRSRGLRLGYLSQEPVFSPGHRAVDAVLEGRERWSEAMAQYDAVVAKLSAPNADLDALTQEQASLAALVENLGGWEIEHVARACLAHFGIRDAEQQVAEMSGGERRRVALARLLVSEPDIAVLDEPTNHLDLLAIEGLESWLVDRFRGAVLMVTHDRQLLQRVASKTWEIDGGALYRYDGAWDAYLQGKAERLAQAAREDANRRNFLRRELEWLSRQPKARSTKQKARIDRAEAAMAVSPLASTKVAAIAAGESRAGKMLLEADDISVQRGGRTLVEGLTLRLQPGQRIGLVGANGCGKSSLLRVLLGHDEAAAGEVRQGKNLKVGYLDQARGGLDPEKSVFANVAAGRAEIQLGGESLTIRSYLERFLFDPLAQRRLVSTLSGGERARVALARTLAEDANLIVLDEPTNDLDVDTLTALEECLLDYGGCVLIVTHDRFLLDRVATHVLAFDPDAPKVQLYHGGYSDWQERRKQEIEERSDSAAKLTQNQAVASAASSTPTRTKSSGLTYGQRLELEALPEKIEAADEAVTELEARLMEADFYSLSHQEQREHHAKLATAKAKQEKLYQTWEELECRRESSER